MHGWKGWTAYAFAVLGIELVLAYMIVGMAIESEYCDDLRVSRWECSESLGDVVGVAVLAFPVFAIVAALVIRHERTRR